ncbi:MAG: hypothetical protein KC635_11805 [Myxococcales bacterium]|nr:hypothetical protein [Myxococcales bacterium]MCB9733982.1 hypothetical protein [Deltaproteobacteria bacterium]
MIRASAPGKLMLAGEYTSAVSGGRALAAAVGRRLHVTLAPGGDAWRVTSEALGLVDAPPADVPVVEAVLARFDGLAPAAITIESELGVGDSKLGLGGSAALCVALFGALRRYAGMEAPSVADVVAAHREAQGGRGSGYDVATALLGGVVLYDNAASDAPTARRVDWPGGLFASVLHTGHGASTVELLDRVTCWRDEDPEDMRAYLGPLVSETRDFIDAWLAGDVQRILTAAAQVQEELDAFDRAGEIGIYAGGQMQLLAAIEDAAAIGRTAGAGGGDCAWALADRPGVIERAVAAAEAAGFHAVDAAIPGDGLIVEDGAAATSSPDAPAAAEPDAAAPDAAPDSPEA